MQDNEREKYEAVFAAVKGYGKDWTHPSLGSSVKRWLTTRIPIGSSVCDFGAGPGSSLYWLTSKGYISSGIELARNATTHPAVVVADLRQPDLISLVKPSQYGMCTDVMEHIPTEDVDSVLFNIASLVTVGCLFVIARDEDKDGKAIGQILHVTRKPKEWWDEKMLQHFKRVEVLRYEIHRQPDAAYVLWAWK